MESLKHDIERMTNIIIEDYHPDAIILFGSCAAGSAQKGSDIDLMVISDAEQALPRTKRGKSLRLKLAEFSTPYDLLIFTHEEISRFQNIAQSFAATVLREGVVLYGK